MEKRHPRTEQLRHIEAWQRSALSKPQYCQQYHIAVKSLYIYGLPPYCWLHERHSDILCIITVIFRSTYKWLYILGADDFYFVP